MPEYRIPMGGVEYDVEAPDLETANAELKKHIQKEFNAKEVSEIEASPAWQRPFQAIGDVARVGVDTVGAGIPDYLAGGDQAAKTAAARDRMGWAGTALDVATAARLIPTAVPKVVAAMGGGPAARTVVGAGTAAGEGAAYGGVSAATHGEDVPTGTGLGALGGMLGHTLGSAVNRVKKAFSPSDIPPASSAVSINKRKSLTGPQKIEATINKAKLGTSGSDTQHAVQTGVKGLLTNAAPKEFTPEQTRLMKKVISGDPATNASRVVGEFLTNKLLAGGAGLSTLAAGAPITGALVGGGMLAGGKALKAISAGGTEEAVQNLRRTMTRTRKFKGPISEEEKARIANMVRQGLLSYGGEE